MNLRRLSVLTVALALLGGCVTVRPTPEAEQRVAPVRTVTEPGHYVITPGHGADGVAELRAAPPPDLAEVTPGTAIRPDERKLASRSYVRIGTGCYVRDNDAARDWTIRTGARVGADKILFYTRPEEAKAAEAFDSEVKLACTADDAAVADETVSFIATFYVHYKLPFGAKFRSMSAAEMKELDVAGGVQIGEVIAGTPAAEANLRSGDFVLKFNGTAVHDRAAFQDLLRANMGKRVTLTVARNGDQFDRLVRLGVAVTDSRGAEK